MSRSIVCSSALPIHGLFLIIVLTISVGSAWAQTSVVPISSVFGVSATLVPANTPYAFDGTDVVTDPYARFADAGVSGSWQPTTTQLLSTSYQVAPWEGTWNDASGGNNGSSSSYPWGQTDNLTTGGKTYDVEAMYVGNDSTNFYLSVVTSIPPVGQYNAPWNRVYYAGDIGIDITQPSSGDTSRTYSGTGFSYDYGINVTNETRTGDTATMLTADPNGTISVYDDQNADASGNITGPGSITVSASGGTTYSNLTSVGNGLYQTPAGSWYVAAGTGNSDPNSVYTNFDPTYSGLTSVAGPQPTVSYSALMYNGVPVLDDGVAMYLINATIPMADLPALTAGEEISFSYAPGCRNDYMQVSDTVEYSTPELPTPALLVLSMAPVGFAWARRRRKRS